MESYKVRIARKEWRCELCGEQIRAGTEHAVLAWTDKTGYRQARTHVQCLREMAEGKQ